MNILGADSGKYNYAISIIDVNEKEITPIYSTLIKNPIAHLKDGTEKDPRSRFKHAQLPSFSISMPLFQKEVRSIINKYKPKIACAERFQSRGNGGTTIEILTSMNYGLLWEAHQKKSEVLLITASQWKNKWNKNKELGLEIFVYPENDRALRKKNVHHYLDASLIAIFAAQKHFDQLQTKEAVIAFINKLANVIDYTERK